MAAAGAAAYLGLAPFGDAAPHPFNQDRNAVWLEHRWLEREHPSEEMDALFGYLAAHGVQYVFPHLIPFNTAGRSRIVQYPISDRAIGDECSAGRSQSPVDGWRRRLV